LSALPCLALPCPARLHFILVVYSLRSTTEYILDY
jgi:hypothetical protein